MENIQLKTGFDTILTNVNDDDDSKINMAALLTVFMENAMNTAGIYTKHSNRKIISSIDISMALKKEVFTFLESDNLLERANEIALEFKDKNMTKKNMMKKNMMKKKMRKKVKIMKTKKIKKIMTMKRMKNL